MKDKRKKFFKIIKSFVAILILVAIFFVFYLIFEWRAMSGDILDNHNLAGDYEYAIVFGASVKDKDTPSDILADRLKKAYEIYKDGKVKKVLLSGDGARNGYSETITMKNYAVKLGFDENDIQVDSYGINTYNTCYRAKNIFNIDSAILVTQKYHLNRAIYLCDYVGVDSIGVPSDLNVYTNTKKFQTREVFAFIMNWFKVRYYKITNV